MTFIVRNLQLVRDRITTACVSAGRQPDSVRLMAVSKKFGADAVLQAVSDGQRVFGENYVAEGVEKITALNAMLPADIALEWHCIGPVQSNKTRLVAEHFDWVQSVDRLKIAERLNEQRPVDAKRLQVCIQVNIDGSRSKSGIAPNEVLALAQEIVKLPRLQLRGIMAIPDVIPNTLPSSAENAIYNIAVKAIYTPAKAVFDQLNKLDYELDTLSIGMSADLEPAIQAGSTMVRVGSAIFGGRS